MLRWIALAGFLLNLSALAMASDEPQKRVLVLYTTRKEAPNVDVSERVYQRTLNDGLAGRLDYYSEYIDVVRFPVPSYRSALRDFLRRKYDRQRFDLIIATSNLPLDFVSLYGAELFPGAAVVFSGVEVLRPNRNSTGVFYQLDMKGVLELALRVQPRTRRVFVVSGVSDFDKWYESLARRQFQEFEGRLEITYLTGLTMAEMRQAASNLPEDSIIFYVVMTEDRAGNKFLPSDALDKLSAAANAPIYTWLDLFQGHGILGGKMISQNILSQKAAELGLRVLRGERPEDIPITEIDPTVIEFDWRQLKRWGISENRLPAGSIVRFRAPSIWDEYKWHIIGLISLVVSQSALIAGLVINRLRRKRADRALGESQTQLSGIVGSAMDAIITADSHQRIVLFNHAAEELFLCPAAEAIGQPLDRFLPERFRAAHAEHIRSFGETGAMHRSMAAARAVYGLRSNGEEFPLEASISQLEAHGEKFFTVILRDITERKRAEQGLQQALAEVSELKDQLRAENAYLQEEIKLNHNFEEIIGQSDALKYVLHKVEQVAASDTTALILGETGTGKELIARAIHHASPRRDRPLVKVNCAALPASLIESELFGHEKGAFTGAVARKLGRFELAKGGTLFLDEIGELPLELQPKLLRALQEGEFERVGGTQTIKADVRVIAATNRNLKAEIQAGLFREDLWYRLNVFPLTLPPLRQRKDDIPLLVKHFVKIFSKKLGKPMLSVGPGTLKAIQNYSWPGNIRELANVIERAAINSQGPVLELADNLEPAQSAHLSSTDGKSLVEMEREIITQRLVETDWKIEGPQGAAKSLGLNPSTLRLRMNKLGIQRP